MRSVVMAACAVFVLAFVLGACEAHTKCEGGGERTCTRPGAAQGSPAGGATADAALDAAAVSDASVTIDGGSATDADTASDAAISQAERDASLAPSETWPARCGAASDFASFAAAGRELIVDSVTEALLLKTNPLGIVWDPVSDPRYSAETMPWIERGQCDGLTCRPQPMTYVEDVLGGPETDYAIVAAVAYQLADEGLPAFAGFSNEDAQDLVRTINTALGSDRALFAAAIMPNDRIERQIVEMDRLAPDVVAWVLTPWWSPDAAGGFFLDDPLGQQTIEHGLALERPIFIVDKGMSGYHFPSPYFDPRDIGPTAAQYPDAQLIVRHGAFEYGFELGDDRSAWPEGPYDETDADVQAAYPLTRGVNSLIKSLRDNGVGPNQNVYVALDEVWAHLITRPVEAAHVLGKLLEYVGEDNILWATDSVFYGAPHPQVEAFRAFEIPAELQDQYGYPALTEARKSKILGLNAARLFCLRPE